MGRTVAIIIALLGSQVAGLTEARAISVAEIRGLVADGRTGSAAFKCDTAKAEADRAGQSFGAPLRQACAQANLALGDKLARIRSYREAMKRWRTAATLDPSLADQADYVRRLETGLPPGVSGTASVPKTAAAAKNRADPAKATVPRTPSRKPPRRVTIGAIEPEFPQGPRGPRHGRIIGLGITGGWDGVFGFSIGWMHAERVAIEIATDLFFSTLDTRIKVFGLKEAVTPFIGVGMLTPFGEREKNPSGGQRVIPRFGLDIPRYGNLFAIGQMMHVDIGISWAVWKAEISAGAAFYTSFDADDPNQLIFFPQFGAQVMFYLP